MYGERIGAFTFLCGDEESAAKVLSQVKIMIRTMYSNAPLYGARLVTEILNNNALRQQWLVDRVFLCSIVRRNNLVPPLAFLLLSTTKSCKLNLSVFGIPPFCKKHFCFFLINTYNK